MRTIDVTLSTLSSEYPVLTKVGNVWPKRINWTHIEVKGNIIVTHFGTFTFIEAERIDKIWFWTLEDENGQLIKIKRDQARKNKRMPKNAEIVNNIRLPKIAYQLCLPEPKELIDILLEETIRLVTEHNNKNVTKKGTPKKHGMWITWEQVKNNFPNPFESKTNYILGVAATKVKNLKSIYNRLAAEYHPDRSHRDTNQEFAIISKFYNSYK